MKTTPIQRNQRLSPRALIASLIVFVVVGAIVLATTHATSLPIAFEAENGTTSGATKVSDSTASGGGSVKFTGSAASIGLHLIATQADLTTIKQQITSGDKAAYWSYIQGSYATRIKPEYTPDWSGNVTYNGSTFNPTRFVADDLDSTSVNNEGGFILSSSQNAYGCAVKWYFTADQACGTQAIAILSEWSAHFTTVTPLASGNVWDIRGNQIRLYAGWSVPNFTKAASLLWDDPVFTPALKTQFSNWLWNTWLMQHAALSEDVHAPGEVLGQNSWNGRDTAYQARIFAGLTMKAAGNPNGSLVINDAITKIHDRLPEDLYYGTAPWHQILGSPWPVEPLSYQGTYYASADHMRLWWKIDNTLASPFSANMIGISVETGRDVGHEQMGTASLAEAFTALRINGYDDWFAPNQLGSVLLQLGEKEAKVYNEALDAYWASPSSYPFNGSPSIDGMSCGWQPSAWSSYHFVAVTKSTNCPTSAPAAVTFVMGGASADNGWEFLRSGLKQDGYATPQLDRLVSRLRGVGTASGSHVAGHGVVGLANAAGWDPLFALDYH